MHDIWNPWHGCVKCSEGCENCYMYYLDKMRDRDGSVIYRTKTGFYYPLHRDRSGAYTVRSGEMIRVSMTSDFFLAEADLWRPDAWDIIRERPDVKFYLLTKRPERVRDHLPDDWGDGWENVTLNVTAENQRRADERLPILLSLPAKHKGVMCAPLIGPVSLSDYLGGGQIEQVGCGGENYDGARPCRYEWVLALRDECAAANVTFDFFETGTVFIKDNKRYNIPDKRVQSVMAYKSGASFRGRQPVWKLTDKLGFPIPDGELYKPRFEARCRVCGSRSMCNGCSGCGKCRRGGGE